MSKKQPKFPDGLPRFWAIFLAFPGFFILAVSGSILASGTGDIGPNDNELVGVAVTTVFSLFLLYWAYKVWTNRLGNRNNIRTLAGLDQFFSLGDKGKYDSTPLIVVPLMIVAFIGFQVLKRSADPQPEVSSDIAVSELVASFATEPPRGIVDVSEVRTALEAHSEACYLSGNGACDGRTVFRLDEADSGTAVSTYLIPSNGEILTATGQYEFTLSSDGVCDSGITGLIIDAPSDFREFLEGSFSELYEEFPYQCENFSDFQENADGFSATSHTSMRARDGTWYYDPETVQVVFR